MLQQQQQLMIMMICSELASASSFDMNLQMGHGFVPF
jgi:hypothetical protein